MLVFNWEFVRVVFHHSSFKKEWINDLSQAPNAIVLDDVIRVFFSSRAIPINAKYISYSGYFDLSLKFPHDLISISERPVVELGNIGEFDEFGIYPFSVVKFKNEYFAAFGGWTRLKTVPFDVQIGMAKSLDCKSFNKIGTGPIIGKSLDEPFVIASPKIRNFNNKLFIFYISGRKWLFEDDRWEPVYKIRAAYSDDGKNWIKMGRNLIEDRLGDFECQAAPDVIQIEDAFYMVFSYRKHKNYLEDYDSSYKLGLAKSFDLINWSRCDDNLNIKHFVNGFDDFSSSYANLFLLGEYVYLLYTGNGIGRTGIGLLRTKI
jgi:hypothetical protein